MTKKNFNNLLQCPESEPGGKTGPEPSTRGAGVQISMPFLHKKIASHKKMACVQVVMNLFCLVDPAYGTVEWSLWQPEVCKEAAPVWDHAKGMLTKRIV